MNQNLTPLQNYYNDPEGYLAQHEHYLATHDPIHEVDLLIDALDIKPTDRILDIACGQGRHSNEFAKRGYVIDGVDFSTSLLDMAKQDSIALKQPPSYYFQNIEDLNLPAEYDVAYWFFPDFADINLPLAIKSISAQIKPGGTIFIDSDSLFNIIKRIGSNNPNYYFDPETLQLIDSARGIKVLYPTYPMWEEWLEANGLSVSDVWGDYDASSYTVDSPRLILLAHKSQSNN